MQLASQELFGFKSFAKRIRFDFGSGVTIIVGPNGCGKSNVVDSLKWVLGEQSAKSLRGQEMMDIIFNGSKNRKPLGFAEATMTFKGCRGVIHEELDEISVTRKLFRSGESEYMINRKPCRLKDIRELFMDTGVGMKAYSIIEQGRIDALLQASGSDRRAIFDEAAGISRYKARKKETQRRLERTDQNLTIIDMTLEQVGKRLRSLKIQAGRARKYLQYKRELRKYRIAQGLHQYHSYRQEQVRVSGELVLSENEKDGLAANLGSLEAELSLLEEQLREHQEEHRSAVSERDRLDQQLTSDRQYKDGLRSHLEDLGKEEIRFQSHLTECLNQIEKSRGDIAGAKERLKAEQEEEAVLLSRIREAEERKHGFDARLDGIAEEIKDLKGEAVDTEAAQSGERTRIGRIEEDLAKLGRERAGAEATHREHKTRHDHSMVEIDRLRVEVEELVDTADGLSQVLGEAMKEVVALREQYTLLEQQERERVERKLRDASRIDVLQKYRDRLEGVGEGAARVVREGAGKEATLEGIVGLLADRFRVEANHVKAIEAAIHNLADAVVVEDLESGLDALAFLKEKAQGRGCFLPRPSEAASPPDPDEYRYPGVVGRASDLVKYAEEDRSLVERVLGRVLVVERLDVAIGLQDLLGDRYTFATLSGEILEPGRLLVGGVALKGRMAHAAELEELGLGLLGLNVEIERIKAERDEKGKALGAAEEKEDNLRHEIYELRMRQIANHQTELENFEAQARELAEQLRTLDGEIDRIVSDQEVREREQADGKATLERLTVRAGEIREAIGRLEAEQAFKDAERAEEETRYHDLRVEHRGVSERVHYQENEVDRIATEIRAREEAYRDTVGRIEENGEKRESLRGEIAALEEQLLAAARRLKEVMEEAERLREVSEGLQQDVSFRDAEARRVQARLEEVRGRITDLQLKEKEYDIRIEGTVARASEELAVVLTDLYEDFNDEACDWEENERKVLELKDKIHRLGGADPNTIKECEEEEARFEYLSSQKADLVKAKDQLIAVIRKIDRRSKELFVKTFADIRESFKVLFRKLFGGGKADLFLEDESNVLDSPVEVMAQPKDKKPSSISLLSGGEKVMTCIALLFAIFKAKPSPFCILDEVDAALDEGNIDRFVGMLREFVQGSQFIIITHNKKTMMVGDVIFGVTMQEAGVSKKVSLKIEEAEKVVDEDRGPSEVEGEGEEKPGKAPGAGEEAEGGSRGVFEMGAVEDRGEPGETREEPEVKPEEEPVPAQAPQRNT